MTEIKTKEQLIIALNNFKDTLESFNEQLDESESNICNKILDTMHLFPDVDDKPITLRAYFKALLTTLWREGEGFSGKRPFGNGGWQFDVYVALVSSGYVRGSLDEDSYLEDVDKKQADLLVLDLIKYM